MKLSDFVGNQAVKRRIDDMVRDGRLPHALIIEGAPGSGRRTLAGIIARIAACTGEHKPCGDCAACRSEQSPDITTVVPQKSGITVDQIRAVRSEAYIVPNQSAKRVFIIPDAQLMNPQAQNALLKVLEEPPQTVMFILTCEYTRQLLATVVSRSAVLTLSVPDKEAAERYICSAYPQYSAEDVRAACTGGTIGDALNVLSGAAGYLDAAEKAAELLMQSELSLHKFMHAYEKDRPTQKGISEEMLRLFHDALVIRSGASRTCAGRDISEKISRCFTSEQLMRLCGVCERAVSDCEANMSGAVLVTVFCASLARAAQE